ncbi:tyrosine-protein phosphatase [Paenibacillus terrigena]|uniref:tyrosine-protein phosphatase n=1 Tax=Paenibacillus terrigena TaxID=369333 RepID=UPI0028D0C4FF|nr:tyrosine-protein phosphatase [Paenibacillus terrigena]
MSEHVRYIELEGTANVRDLVGYKTQNGQETAWHRVLRVDSLHKLTPADKKVLLDLDVRQLIDLRFEEIGACTRTK